MFHVGHSQTGCVVIVAVTTLRGVLSHSSARTREGREIVQGQESVPEALARRSLGGFPKGTDARRASGAGARVFHLPKLDTGAQSPRESHFGCDPLIAPAVQRMHRHNAKRRSGFPRIAT